MAGVIIVVGGEAAVVLVIERDKVLTGVVVTVGWKNVVLVVERVEGMTGAVV